MNDNILNNWQFLHAKAVELNTLTKALNPTSDAAVKRAVEIADEIQEVVKTLDIPEGDA